MVLPGRTYGPGAPLPMYAGDVAERRGATVHRHSWSQEPLARRLTPHVLEVDGADHGMYVPGPLTDSTAVLGRVAGAVEDFLEAIEWPGG